jgi:hypothetical protein
VSVLGAECGLDPTTVSLSEVSDWVVVKPNTALKKTLAAEPVITPDQPATLKITEHGTFNGFDTAKCSLRCMAFSEDAESFSLDF